MLLTSLTLALAMSPSCTIDEQVATPEISIIASQDDPHSGSYYWVHTSDFGTYIVVNDKLYRLPGWTKLPNGPAVVTLHGVKKSSTPDADYTATSLTW